MDLYLWGGLGRVKLVLQQNFMGLIWLLVFILERGNPCIHKERTINCQNLIDKSHLAHMSNDRVPKIISKPLIKGNLQHEYGLYVLTQPSQDST